MATMNDKWIVRDKVIMSIVKLATIALFVLGIGFIVVFATNSFGCYSFVCPNLKLLPYTVVEYANVYPYLAECSCNNCGNNTSCNCNIVCNLIVQHGNSICTVHEYKNDDINYIYWDITHYAINSTLQFYAKTYDYSACFATDTVEYYGKLTFGLTLVIILLAGIEMICVAYMLTAPLTPKEMDKLHEIHQRT